MPDIQLGVHTFKSHGITVARFHMHDWLVLLFLMVLEITLDAIEPFHRFVGENMMTDLTYPLKPNSVPVWAVPIIGIGVPLVVFNAFYFKRRDVYDLHHAVLGVLYSVLISGVITDAIKDAVGRPRPDFFWRCFPSGKGVFDPITKGVICNGDPKIIKEGYKSFPSGHTSWSFASMVFLAWYLAGKIRVFDCKGHIAKLCIVLLPLLVAAFIGISRVDDYWHHWQDVFGGALLGTTVASLCYLQFFPYPHLDNACARFGVEVFMLVYASIFIFQFGWAPHAYFTMLLERNSSGSSSTTNSETPLHHCNGEMV